MSEAATESRHSYIQALLPLDKIERAGQVRKDWRHDDGAARLDELTESIKEHGVQQSLLVRPIDGTDRYMLIAGHRRYVSAKRAGENALPVMITHATDAEAMVLQLVENIQRQDLDPMDEADAIHEIMSAHGWGIAEISRQLGKHRPWVMARVRVAQDSALREAVGRGLIAVYAAYDLACLPAPYDQPFRDKLSAGRHVRRREIEQARADAHRAGVYSELDVTSPLTQQRVDDRAQQVKVLRGSGMSHGEIAKKVGVSEKSVRNDLKRLPAEPTYATPKVSPLPWENEPPAGLAVTVDERSTVIDATPVTPITTAKPAEPAERPPLDTSEPHYGRNPEHVVMGPPAPRTAIVPATPPVDPDVRRIGFMVHGMPEGCQDTMGAVIRLGMERGWSCSELSRRIDAARRDMA